LGVGKSALLKHVSFPAYGVHMARKQAPAGAKAIEKALRRFSNPRSDLHRRVQKSLNRLEKVHLNLLGAFKQRAIEREAQVAKSKHESLASANASLKRQQKQYEQHKRMGNRQLTDVAETLLKVAEQQVETAKKCAEWQESLAAEETKIDEGYFNWIDQFISQAVESLFSDAAADSAIALLSGGLILAGVTGGTSVAIAAAVGSAMILANDIKAKLTPKGRAAAEDRETARTETALALIDCSTSLAKHWLVIVQPRRT